MDPRAALTSFIRWVMSDTVYLGVYACTVETQHDDDSLSLLPDDETMRGTGLAHVEIRHGIPGVRVRVSSGARVGLWFENGNPTLPRASLWEPGSIESLQFDGGQNPIARVGDPVTVFWPPSVPVVGTLAGLAFVGTMTITQPGIGLIETGAPKAKA